MAFCQTAPLQQHTPWSVILCKFSDHSWEPKPPLFFQRLLTMEGVGYGGAADYLAEQSYNRISLTGSVVKGWYTMDITQSQILAMSRDQRAQACMNTAAANGYTVPSTHRVTAVFNNESDPGASGYGHPARVVLDFSNFKSSFVFHELLHVYGLGHSYSDANIMYDNPWDEMSADAIFHSPSVHFEQGPVNVMAYSRDRFGWIPRDRIKTFGADGQRQGTVILSSISTPSTPGILLLRIPFDPTDFHHYYTVEFRKKVGWDSGIVTDTVLINEIKNGRPHILRHHNQHPPNYDRPPVQSLVANGVTISAGPISGNTVTVSVTNDHVYTCLVGYVWRQARPADKVCVTPATKTQVEQDNAAASSRWVPGTNNCITGYVWREAYLGDKVCVTSQVRDQTLNDNAAAASRCNPTRFVGGPNTCKPGYVWRDADKSDYVCVTTTTRAQVQADNAIAPSRWTNGAYGPHTCVSGYVWRGAFIGDDVCVTSAQKLQAAEDNNAAKDRIQPEGQGY